MNNTYWSAFCQFALLLAKDSDGHLVVPLAEEPPTPIMPWQTIHEMPSLDGTSVKAYAIDSPVTQCDNMVMCGLRKSFYHLPTEHYLMAGKCHEILYWDHNTRFCGVCGGRMLMHTNISKRCEECGKEVWPQLATAVICLIYRGDEVMMVRARNFRGDFYGLVAGFVETGETLEEAVEREIAEEVGLRVKNIRYYGSQPWPYPSGLMVGFYAEYDGGSVHLQQSELSSGGWFRYDNLPTLPEPLSIARKLIDHWLEMHNNQKK